MNVQLSSVGFSSLHCYKVITKANRPKLNCTYFLVWELPISIHLVHIHLLYICFSEFFDNHLKELMMD